MALFRRARLHLVGVFRPAPIVGQGLAAVTEPNTYFREDLRSHLEAVAHDVSVFHRLRPEPVLLEGTGSVAAQLLEYAALHDIGLTVLRTHGRTGLGRIFLGSVADGLINAGHPCLLLRDRDARGASAEAQLPGIFRRILVPMDGGDDARAALEMALDVATPGVSEIRLVRVVPPGETPVVPAFDGHLADDATWIEEHGIKSRSLVVEHESPAEGILACVEAQRIDLVAIASHHRSETGRLLSGSVIDALVSRSEVPLLARRLGVGVGRGEMVGAGGGER
jgi:nucleotide-binding universal stress UspA family protein